MIFIYLIFIFLPNLNAVQHLGHLHHLKPDSNPDPQPVVHHPVVHHPAVHDPDQHQVVHHPDQHKVLHSTEQHHQMNPDGTCVEGATCVLPVQCPAHFYSTEKNKCLTGRGRVGICCTTGQNHTETFTTHKGRHHHGYIDNIDPTMLGAVTRRSRVEIHELRLHEARMLATGRASIIPMGSASYGHFRNTRVYSPSDLAEVMGVANRALEIALATKAFKERQGLTNQQLEWSMVQQNLRPTPLGSACAPLMRCPRIPERYRRIDGTCNNIFNPHWGIPLSPYARLLPPSYQDGIWAPRVSEDQGQHLQSPRKISSTLFADVDAPHKEFTLMIMQYGQFLSHEITQSIDTTFANGSAISCCTPDGAQEVPAEIRHFACMPIRIPKKDAFFSHFKQGCMNFVRSNMAPRTDCTLGYAQQMNKVTHYIDGSSVYGSTPDQTAELRSFISGKLKVFNDFGRDLLPLSKDPDACLTMEQGSACFESGDSRTNQMISLVALHTVFMREHNRLAEKLHQINSHWNDEKIFVEARRILTAIMQVITYKEFLPALLGEGVMEDFGIALKPGTDYSYDYDQRIEPSVTNEFAAAAFRFGHSTVDGLVKIYGVDKMDEMISIPETMFFPGRMRKHLFYDQILSALTTEPIQKVDSFISETLTKYMFRAGNPFGVDLASLNIQRGRDHGLRPYNDYRQLIGLHRYTRFDEFGPHLGPKLASVYDSIDDVDLWVGGLIEEKYEGSILGPTFTDIIADQFVRLKKGDKYFFDHDPSINPGHFSSEQLLELRKASMSRLICDNSDGFLLARQAPNAFRMPGILGNEFVDCSSPLIPQINLMHWQDFA